MSPFGEQQTVAVTAVASLGFVANIAIARTTGGYFDAPAEGNPLLHTWSLSVEEQFYLVFPLFLAAAFAAQRRGRGHAFWWVTAVSSLSFAVACVAWWKQLNGTALGFYSPVGRVWEFGAGAMLALSGGRAVAARWSTVLGVVGAGLVLASAVFFDRTTWFPGPMTVVPVLGTVFLVHAGATEGATRTVFSWPALVRLGDWSYSIYLWHWPLIVFARLWWPGSQLALSVAALLCVGPALLSFARLEGPLRSWVGTRAQTVRFIAVTLAVPLLCAAGLAAGAAARWGLPWPYRATNDEHLAMARGCVDATLDVARCSWGVGPKTVAVLGDSQAYAFADAVIAAGDELGFRTVVSSRSGCPAVLGDTSGSKPMPCASWQREVLAFVQQAKPEVVVLVNRTSGYLRPESGWRTMLDEHGRPARDAAQATQLYADALGRMVAELRATGAKVLVVHGVPESPLATPRDSLQRRFFPESEVRFGLDGGARAAMLALERDAGGSASFDPATVLCDGGGCRARSAGQPLYVDDTHLSRAGALTLAPAVQRLLAGEL